MPGFEDRVHFYRLTNALFSLLESSEKARLEMLQSRYALLASQRKKHGQRLLVAVGTALAAIPAVFEILPDEIGGVRWVWLVAAVAVAVLYLVVICRDWSYARAEERELSEALPIGAQDSPEDRPGFLKLGLSLDRTRWEMASSVLEADDLPQVTAKMFEEIRDHWANKLNTSRSKLDELVQGGVITAEERARLAAWIPRSSRAE